MKTILNSAYLSLHSTRGYLLAQGAPKGLYGAARRISARGSTRLSRFRGNTWEARAAPPAARCHVALLSVVPASFQIWAPGFDETIL